MTYRIKLVSGNHAVYAVRAPYQRLAAARKFAREFPEGTAFEIYIVDENDRIVETIRSAEEAARLMALRQA